jgi:hypothetical protein
MIVIGWSGMVTGQSVVLYSRLHLVDRNRVRLRLVLGMIIFNAVICHIPIIVMIYGANGSNPDPWIMPYSIYEKVQVTIFFLQELLISGLYLAATVRFFRLEAELRGTSASSLMRHLIGVNAIVIILDITILGLEYAGYYDLQTAYKALVYSVKLKLEFNVLNNLIDLTKARAGSGERGFYPSNDRTGNDKSVALETFDGRKGKHRRQPSERGYNAFVRSEGARGAEPSDGIVVMTTTEVNVAPEPKSEPQTDHDSIVGTLEGQKSSSSSEVGFAKSGY